MEFEVLIVDDGSTDGTSILIMELQKKYNQATLISRDGPKSLPSSILEGVTRASYSYVAWLDADCSMPIVDLSRFWKLFMENENLDLVVGSRFVQGGAVKGQSADDKLNIKQHQLNIKNSEDSFLAIHLSHWLNYLLRLLLPCGIRDLTSGFIIVKKSIVKSGDIAGSYGDYCPRFLYRVVKRKASVIEVGYECQPRKYGVSKTGVNLVEYLKKGLPYIVSAIKVRLTMQKSSN
jgi:dolichol-phosphate mannosyltransferase